MQKKSACKNALFKKIPLFLHYYPLIKPPFAFLLSVFDSRFLLLMEITPLYNSLL